MRRRNQSNDPQDDELSLHLTSFVSVSHEQVCVCLLKYILHDLNASLLLRV